MILNLVLISGEKKDDYYIINSNVKINYYNPIVFSIGLKNIGDHTNSQYGPFIGREFYLEILTTMQGK